MATANDFAVANSYLPPKKPVLGQNELAVWDSDLLVENRKIFIPHMYLVPPQGVTQTPSEFRENV